MKEFLKRLVFILGNKLDFFLRLYLVVFACGTRERSGWLCKLETFLKIFLSCLSIRSRTFRVKEYIRIYSNS